ncbi:MAG: hypothetical protein AAGG46_03705, partial [Planctomycetota bacterium]
ADRAAEAASDGDKPAEPPATKPAPETKAAPGGAAGKKPIAQPNAKPESASKPESIKPADATPRVAAAPSTTSPLKWVPAGVGKAGNGKNGDVTNSDGKNSNGKNSNGAASEAKSPEKGGDAKTTDTQKQAGEPPTEPEDTSEKSNTGSADSESTEPPAGKTADTDDDVAGAPDKSPSVTADSDPEASEPSEPAPFPQVIEIDEPAGSESDAESAVEGPAAGKPADDTKAPSLARKEPTSRSEPPLEVAPPKPLEPLTSYQRSLRTKVRSVLSYYYRRPLNSIDHDPWEVMHHMLAYGQHSRVLDGSRRSKPMTAVGYLCFNMPCQRKQMMSLTADGLIETRVDVGMQGHKGQLLAMLAQCGVSAEYPIRVDGAELTINDLIRSEKLSCYAGEELSFKLIGLMHYLGPDAVWVNDQGETWNFSRLINEERNQKIRGAPCGGTHRLSGLSLAVSKRMSLGQPIDGEYLQAKQFVDRYASYAFRWQNPDGSLSTEWFRGPGAEEDINRRARTTGHLLEWLLYTVPKEQLTDTRIVRAVNYLSSLLASNTGNPWEIGPLSHALHALLLYDERVFSPHDEALIAAAQRSGKSSSSPANLSYRNIDSRVVRTMPSADAAEAAREEIANANTGFRGLFRGRRKPSNRNR